MSSLFARVGQRSPAIDTATLPNNPVVLRPELTGNSPSKSTSPGPVSVNHMRSNFVTVGASGKFIWTIEYEDVVTILRHPKNRNSPKGQVICKSEPSAP